MAAAPERDRRSVVGALVLVQVFFGIHYLAAKVLLEFIPPRAWAALRVVPAAVLLLIAARALGRRIPTGRGDLIRLAVFSVFGVVINQVCFVEGLSRTTPAHSSIIMTSIPVGTLLFGVILGQETLTSGKILSLVFSFAGVMLVIVGGRGGAGLESLTDLGGARTVVGDLLTLVNALSYSFFLVISKRLLTRVDPLGATAVLLTFGSVGVLLVGMPELLAFSPASVPPKIWGLGLYIVVFPTALAYLLMYWTLARAGSYLVALFIYLQPLIATALSATLLGERIGAAVVMGGGLIFLGVYLALRPDGGSSGPGTTSSGTAQPTDDSLSARSRVLRAAIRLPRRRPRTSMVNPPRSISPPICFAGSPSSTSKDQHRSPR
jgi:O-acetylserine/cysteine efflux transporter